ncbi:hypothetical protein CJF42_06295 [Pseudoalteromonas sp. NBT06-2]|nr:hypothetical protein CJF42_06295 [Pseudoalteromonas sp. NBT06-2]
MINDYRTSFIFVMLLFLIGGCGGSSSSEKMVDIVPDPIVDDGTGSGNDSGNDNDTPVSDSSLSVVGHSENNLMAIASVITQENAQVIIEFSSENTALKQTLKSDLGKEHVFTIVGMRENTPYNFKAIITDSNNQVYETDIETHTTGDLPADAPIVEVLTHEQNSLGGITFFAATEGASTFYGVDEAGEYVWYLHGDNIPMSASPVVKSLGDGRLMLLLTRAVWIIDTKGEILQTYDLPTYHHDVNLLSNGNLLVLTTEVATINNEQIKGDKIIELDQQGNTLWQWSSFEHMDTERFPGVLANRINNGQKDWTHSNALFYDPHDDTILLSSRSQSWVLNIDHQTGNVLWILGDDKEISNSYSGSFFTLNNGSWMASQHAAMFTNLGDILIFDNRNESELAGNINNSRAVRYNINTNEMTAVQNWEYIAPKYTQALGDVDELSNGNILINAGGPGSSNTAHIIEVTPELPSQVTWELIVLNTAIYRAERISWQNLMSSSVGLVQTPPNNVNSPIDIANCSEAVNFVDTNNSDNYIDYNLDGNTNADLFGDALKPTLSVTCDDEVLYVTSNGATNFDWINLGQGSAIPSTIYKSWTIPRNPNLTSQQVAIPLLGPIAVTVTGLQIFGPNENSADNYANPVTDGLLNYCGGHTREYHFHERAKCFFEWETLGGAESLLPAQTSGVVMAYALDGFPIMSPWECSDESCSSTVKVNSSYRYIGTGDYSNENAWNYHEYQADLSPLDECNGMIRPDGSYAYYATDEWPYYMACFKGPTHLVSDNNPRFNP